MTAMQYYVSVTGLVVKGWRSVPKFLYLSHRAHQDSLQVKGNVSSKTFSRDGVQNTLTIWESKEEMQQFMRGDAHRKCMMSMKDVSTYVKVHGYYADKIPTVDEAFEQWKKHGRRVHGDPDSKYGDVVTTSMNDELVAAQ